jgi:fused signal recognition particle receptor
MPDSSSRRTLNVRWKFWERKQPTPEEDTSIQVATTAPLPSVDDDVEVPEQELAEVVVGESAPEDSSPRQGFLRFLKERLTKTRQGLLQKVDRLLSGRRVIDAELFDELEEVFISIDLGVQTTMRIMQ